MSSSDDVAGLEREQLQELDAPDLGCALHRKRVFKIHQTEEMLSAPLCQTLLPCTPEPPEPLLVLQSLN